MTEIELITKDQDLGLGIMRSETTGATTMATETIIGVAEMTITTGAVGVEEAGVVTTSKGEETIETTKVVATREAAGIWKMTKKDHLEQMVTIVMTNLDIEAHLNTASVSDKVAEVEEVSTI